MSRTQESGAYLGGIGTMLQVSHGCPACGQVHEGRKFGFKHRAPRECPLVVLGSFPVISFPNPQATPPLKIPSVKVNVELNRTSDPTPPMGDLSERDQLVRARDAERSRGLGVPWLPPPDLGEVL
ncbi:MAG TPA: hypothetical protein VMH38_09070 [Thermoplasmata archaeon]|nr:hypothetical protein [Thermoplasmata archaeon]